MSLHRFVLQSALCAFGATLWTAVTAQPSAVQQARVRAIFTGFDLNASGWLSGKEILACGCRHYDTDQNGEITWEEFRAGYARALLPDADAAARGARQPEGPGRAERASTQALATASGAGGSPFQVGQTVEVNIDGVWHKASIVNVRDGRYALSRHDRGYGVTTDEECG
jgi:hypothetical protein